MVGKEEKIDLKDSDKNGRKDGVIPVSITTEVKKSYLDYAMTVITMRALPDVRDGLKPVHRRILFAMNDLGLSYSARFRKSAAVVGDVLGKYHPHGDSSVYIAMVKMAQDFSYRYPLVAGQGNFGSLDGDAPAAMRYTEAKMSQISTEMLRDINKETVDFVPNYDGTKKEPTVLPAAIPALLLNGTLGIAVGMATNIPPHNLGELIDAIVFLIENKDSTTDDLLQFVKGPDFPTGGMVFGQEELRHAYTSGRGGVVCRGDAEIFEDKQTQIIITSIPYRVNKATLVENIADLVRLKKIEGIKGLRDESTKDIRVVIDLKNDAFPQKILNYVYKHTDLETSFHFNLVALVDGAPQTLSLKSILKEFIDHREIVVVRRTTYELKKAEERAHILAGLKKALDHIDKVIKLIRAAKDVKVAHLNLKKEFKFSDQQATAILEMKLQKLAGLERKAVENELKEKLALIADLKALLASPKKILKVVSTELLEIKERYGDVRKTRIIKHQAKSFSTEDLIPNEESVLVYTRGGYVKRTNPDEYKAQRRGGVGVVDLNTKEEDFISIFLSTSTHNNLLFFTDKGKVYQIKMYEIPEGRRATKGKSIMNFLPLAQDERVTSVLTMPAGINDQKQLSLMMVTKLGIAKKVAAESFQDVRKSGLVAIKLGDKDELLSTMFVEKTDSVILATECGQAIRFKESDVRQMGRSAAGVRAIKLRKEDVVISAGLVKKDNSQVEIVVISNNGFGKRTAIKEYKIQNRGGSGIKTTQVTAKTGKLVSAKVVTANIEELIAISKKGQVIRTQIKEIRLCGRQTQGVTIMKLRAGDSIASLICF
ncbi:DNA gyrase subunit A [Patescibacteria group bacterium]|nr:DNA gyrase subunit A [Patescibacteria group bacterium]MBU1246478.1 DNA gyrase subunit A [Patescibacteria group bacterium]MBU1519240.1 DNA gyrase subunit A [Patescibacteria group bacterium]MBU1730020.1 DNA gyrase subunit A [Patescibacteria group bacterium]MBU1956280.1 DNA gyrase subunit A [Patescibacteria group bacterium]